MLGTRRGILAWGGLAAVALLSGAPSLSRADALPKPSGGEIILTVDGAIANSNGDGSTFFDLALLKTLPARALKMETPWTKGEHSFTGVPLEALMQWVGAQGKTVTLFALNDYSVDMPITDGAALGALVVYLLDGQPMLPSDKGPLWLVYPYAEHPETQSETYYQRSVWNLYSMTVR